MLRDFLCFSLFGSLLLSIRRTLVLVLVLLLFEYEPPLNSVRVEPIAFLVNRLLDFHCFICLTDSKFALSNICSSSQTRTMLSFSEKLSMTSPHINASWFVLRAYLHLLPLIRLVISVVFHGTRCADSPGAMRCDAVRCETMRSSDR